MSGNILPEPASFLKYIISLRNENQFHEEICEMIFKTNKDKFEPEDLIINVYILVGEV
jgi:7-cyano-7-deazaguanine reductase